MSWRPVEKFSKSLRRQAQIRVWQRALKDAKFAADAPWLVTSDDESSVPAHSSEGSVICANNSLRNSLARGALETTFTRKVKGAIERSGGKEEAMKAFLVLLHADGETPTAQTFRTLSTTLLQHHVETRMGHEEFNKALDDATGSDIDRWKKLSAEERAVFVNYISRATERWVERGSSYNKLLGFSQEGADNDMVVQVEYQIRKSGASVSVASIADLMHLDISWTTALHLYNSAALLRGRIPPPMEMTDRIMGLMTGYKTGLGGSRPWMHALKLYNSALASGYDTTLTTHTHALDAIWRSADTFHRVQCTLSPAHRQLVWEKALDISQRVGNDTRLHIAGEEGCAYAEGLLKALAASGRWSMAVSLLASLDTCAAQTSFRLLLPTAETYAFAIAACHAAGHGAHGEALWTLFRYTYSLRSLHSEVLSMLLQSFRHVVRISTVVSSVLEELVNDGKGLARSVAVACLQLLSSRHVRTKEQRWLLATRLFCMYDANPWPQQPLARKAELQTVFRCCHLISLMEAPNGKRLLTQLRRYLVDVFGGSAAEVEWLEDTSIYALQVTTRWEDAVRIYDAAVTQRGPEHVPYLPIPLRQAKAMLMEALLRCCKAMADTEDGETFFVDEDTRDADRDAALDLAERAIAIAGVIYTAEDTFPHALCAELMLLRAKITGGVSERKFFALEAMHHFSQASAEVIDIHHITELSAALSLNELHVENALLQGHAALRYATLTQQKEQQRYSNVCTAFDSVTS